MHVYRDKKMLLLIGASLPPFNKRVEIVSLPLSSFYHPSLIEARFFSIFYAFLQYDVESSAKFLPLQRS